MLIVVIGMDTFIVQPGFVQGLVEKGGFGEKQAGYIAAAEMCGIALTTIAMVWLASRIRWRLLVVTALLMDTLGNVLCLQAESFDAFIAARFAVGMASGVLISVGYAVIGGTRDPDRNFGLLITWVLVYGAIGIFAMPSGFALLGLKGVLVTLGLFALAGLSAAPFLPDAVANKQSLVVQQGPASLVSIAMILGAVFCYFLAQGTVWAYLFLIGLAGGGGEQSVANGLTIAQLLGVAGAFTAAIWGPRIRHSTSLIVGITVGILPMFCFLGAKGALIYGAAVSIFNYAANYLTPLLMAVVARCDASGRLIVLAVALQMVGLAIGPALGAAAIAPGDFRPAVLISMGLCIGCLLLILPPCLRVQRDLAAVAG